MMGKGKKALKSATAFEQRSKENGAPWSKARRLVHF